MFGWFRRKDRPFATKPVDHSATDRTRVITTMITGGLATMAMINMVPVIGVAAYVAAAGAGLTALLRAGVYTDFYCRRRNEDGKGTPLTNAFQRQWSRTPLRHLSIWKIENDRRDETLRALFNTLDTRINDAPDDTARDLRRKDQATYKRVVDIVNPNGNLVAAAIGGLMIVGWGRAQAQTIMRNGLAVMTPLMMVSSVIGLAASLAFATMHLAVYSQKKAAAGAPNPLFEAAHTRIHRTPVRYMTGWHLRRQMKKMDKLAASDELLSDMRGLAIDSTLQSLSTQSGYATRDGGMLGRLFNAAAAPAAGTPEQVMAAARPPAPPAP